MRANDGSNSGRNIEAETAPPLVYHGVSRSALA